MLTNETLATTFLDRNSVPQANLDIANRQRTNLLPWVGQFSPQLVEELLVAYGQRAGVVMDPFAGSGTSLIEAARLGKTAWGSDINPAAVILAGVYRLINMSLDGRKAALERLGNRLTQVVGSPDPPLFSRSRTMASNHASQEYALVRLWNESGSEVSRTLAAALVVLCDFYRKDLSVAKIRKNWLRLAETVQSLPVSSAPVLVRQADARALPAESDSVDLVLTSPPYINVHNYHQRFRRSVESIGWNVLNIAPSEIGSNRKNRGNRFVTVIQYALDMTMAIREMARDARPRARLILVLGRESTVRRVPFFNGELVAELAVQGVGLENERRQERQFINRFGKRIREDILHFRTSSDVPDQDYCLAAAREIARQTLSATRQLTPAETRIGIDDALERIAFVSPSPLLTDRDHAKIFA